MKRKYLILIILLLSSVKTFSQNDSPNKTVAYPLKVTLEDIDKHNPYHGRNIFHKLRIRITNTADTAFSFWVKTCSWYGCTSFDPDIVSNFWDCDRNFPEEITLKPDSSFSLDAGYKLDSSIVNPAVRLRVGFRVVITPSNNSAANSVKIDSNEDFLNATEQVFEQMSKFTHLLFNDPKYTKKDYIWSKPITIRF